MIQRNKKSTQSFDFYNVSMSKSIKSTTYPKQDDKLIRITSKNIDGSHLCELNDECKIQQEEWIQNQVINDLKFLQIDEETKEEYYFSQNGVNGLQVKVQSIDVENQGNQDNIYEIKSQESKKTVFNLIKQDESLRLINNKERQQISKLNKNKSTSKNKKQLSKNKITSQNSICKNKNGQIKIKEQNVQIIQIISLQEIPQKTINKQTSKTKLPINNQKQLKSPLNNYYQIDSFEQKQQLITIISKQSIFNKIPEFIGDKFELYSQYRRYIQKILSTKAISQKKDYPQISYSLYRKILTIWQKLDIQTKNKYVGKQKFLKYGHLQRLSHGRWLNDQIISSYLNLLVKQISQNNVIDIQKQQLKDKYLNNFVIFDSLKTISIFEKSCQISISKILQKNNALNLNKMLILIIYDKKHWFFLTCKSKSQTKPIIRITIYDSMPMLNQKQYRKITIIQKILTFMQKYYKSQIKIHICPNYPQQHNNSDCGVIMLCGIKDIIRNNLTWSFQSSDMNYKRILITKQLIQGQIVGL